MQEDFRRRFLAPWQPRWSKRSPKTLFDIGARLLDAPLFGSNRIPIPPALRRQWMSLCAVETFPAADFPAIVVHPSDLRGLPTRQPAFYDPDLPGEGFPFDYLQYSALSAGTPVRVRHRSADGCWLLVETEAMFGWLPATDVVAIDAGLADLYTTASWRVVLEDDVPLCDESGAVLAIAGLGSVWPEAGQDRLWVPLRGADGQVILCQARPAAGDVRSFPLAMTAAHVALLGNRMLGKPYDWGGQFGDRDCSSTLRDLFACFGLYLPRNSAAQAGSGVKVDLVPLAGEQREAFIRDRAVPWLTLGYMPGHIMLYVGEFNGQPAFFHTMWGLKTRDRRGQEGRYPVGRTVITGLRPGEELEELMRPGGLLLERLESLVLLAQMDEV
jgi:hypothetical protein